MNRGAHDDLADYGEVPGHGPAIIIPHLDGDEVALPGAVEHRLRMTRPGAEAHEAVWQRFRDLQRTVPDEPPLPRSADDYGTDDDCEAHLRREEYEAKWRRVREFVGTPPYEVPVPTPDPGRPTVVALTVCVMALILVVCLLAALRAGGAIAWDWAWDWAWVLAPLWVPVSVATVALTLACVWLAALDERDAARRRNRATKGA